MTKYLLILIVLFILMAWTAVRYRRQIAGVIGFARMIRAAADPSRARRDISESKASVPKELVNCVACGTWVPHDRAIRFDAKTFYCSKECVQVHLTAR